MMFADPPEEVLLNIADTLVAAVSLRLRSDVGMLVAIPPQRRQDAGELHPAALPR